MCAGEPLPRAQLDQHGFQVLQGAAHPFAERIVKALAGQGGTHLVIREDTAIIAFGGFIQNDGEIADRRCAQLFTDPLFHITGGLANF